MSLDAHYAAMEYISTPIPSAIKRVRVSKLKHTHYMPSKKLSKGKRTISKQKNASKKDRNKALSFIEELARWTGVLGQEEYLAITNSKASSDRALCCEGLARTYLIGFEKDSHLEIVT